MEAEVIRLRKENPVISGGQIGFLDCGREVFAYRRFLGQDELFVRNNLTGQDIPPGNVRWTPECEKVPGNYTGIDSNDGLLVLRPYETIVYRAHK